MKPDFAGRTAHAYQQFRRDLPAVVVHELVGRSGLQPEDLVLDLGCGTGQVTVPLAPFCRGVLACDVEPDMLVGLASRVGELPIVPVLAGDRDLVRVGRLAGDLGLITVANALHWMDEEQVILDARQVLRPGGCLAILTSGPPLWLGDSDWQRAVREAVEKVRGPASATCGTDDGAIRNRQELLRRHKYRDIELWRHAVDVPVDADFVLGHLNSAMSADDVPTGSRPAFEAAVREAVNGDPHPVERLAISMLLGRV